MRGVDDLVAVPHAKDWRWTQRSLSRFGCKSVVQLLWACRVRDMTARHRGEGITLGMEMGYHVTGPAADPEAIWVLHFRSSLTILQREVAEQA
jgi:hypothetical protein